MRATDNNHCEFRIDNILIYNYYFWHSSYRLILWKIWKDSEHWTLNIEHCLGTIMKINLSKNGNTLLIKCTRFKTYRKSFQHTSHEVAAINSSSISFKDFKQSRSEWCRSTEVGMVSFNRKKTCFDFIHMKFLWNHDLSALKYSGRVIAYWRNFQIDIMNMCTFIRRSLVENNEIKSYKWCNWNKFRRIFDYFIQIF